MKELYDLWRGNGTSAALDHALVMHDIHVLLVDHDTEGLYNTTNLLKMCRYRVTMVELASIAVSMLQRGKVTFDVVMANINSPDINGFKLLQQAVSMGVPTVLISADDSTPTTMMGLQNGAFLCFKKPTTLEMLSLLWQHVLREKMRIKMEREIPEITNSGVNFRQVEENPSNMSRPGNDHTIINKDLTRKMCIGWNGELHAIFMDAVTRLGRGKCLPKTILEVMDVPGLTRLQVASHLQRCRLNNWEYPHKQKFHQSTRPPNGKGSQRKLRRFGVKPQLGKTIPRTRGRNQGPEADLGTEIQNNGGTNHLDQACCRQNSSMETRNHGSQETSND